MSTNKNTNKPAANKDEIAILANDPLAVLNLQIAAVKPDEIAASRFASLKNKELAANCILLERVNSKGEALVVEQARIYGNVLAHDLWKEDDFKNFKEFASKVFNDKPGRAYTLANVGNKFYSAAPDSIEGKLAAVNGWSILDKLSKLTHEELEAHKTELPVDYKLTQDAADKFAKGIVDARPASDVEGKEKPVKTFDFSGMLYRGPYFKTNADGKEEFVPAVAEQVKEEDCIGADEAIVLTDYEVKTFKVKDAVFIVAVDSAGNVQILTKTDHKKSEPVKLDATSYNRIRKGYNKGWSAEDIVDLTGLPADKVKAVFAELDKVKAGNDKDKDA
jgi:hypothetical protein